MALENEKNSEPAKHVAIAVENKDLHVAAGEMALELCKQGVIPTEPKRVEAMLKAEDLDETSFFAGLTWGAAEVIKLQGLGRLYTGATLKPDEDVPESKPGEPE
jgi:hypothetical protein